MGKWKSEDDAATVLKKKFSDQPKQIDNLASYSTVGIHGQETGLGDSVELHCASLLRIVFRAI